MYNHDVDPKNSYRIGLHYSSMTMYAAVDRTIVVFWFMLSALRTCFVNIYKLCRTFEFPSFGFDRRFRSNHYKAISLSVTRLD